MSFEVQRQIKAGKWSNRPGEGLNKARRNTLRFPSELCLPHTAHQTLKTTTQPLEPQLYKGTLKPLNSSAHPCASPALHLHSLASCATVAELQSGEGTPEDGILSATQIQSCSYLRCQFPHSQGDGTRLQSHSLLPRGAANTSLSPTSGLSTLLLVRVSCCCCSFCGQAALQRLSGGEKVG